MKMPIIKTRIMKAGARVCIMTLAYQLMFPAISYGLTSGPSQPEVQSFEPVATTDMVNIFTGDFNYNIPLLDIEGYPINIAYHAGVTMEQEASWVGLGWNLNPGNINHIVRGFSDDYNGDEVKKIVDIKDEEIKRFNIFFGAELAGFETSKVTSKIKSALNSLKGSSSEISLGITLNNYTGYSASIGKRNSVGYNTPWISAGVNMGATVSTDKGVDIDYGLTLSPHTTKEFSESSTMGVSSGIGGGMNTREGMKYSYFGVTPYASGTNVIERKPSEEGENRNIYVTTSVSYPVINESFVPVGLQTYIPVITNASTMTSSFYQLKLGGEVWAIYPYAGGGYAESKVHINSNGTRKAFGYYNLDKATEYDMMDFTRDKDGLVNRKSRFLALPTTTYDIYSVSGQGTGGSFRPYRNDFGTVHDPSMGNTSENNSHLGEGGYGNVVELGYDSKKTSTTSKSGPWPGHRFKFTDASIGSLYEPYYLKQAGELTTPNTTYLTSNQNAVINDIATTKPLRYSQARSILDDKTLNTSERSPRGNLLYFSTADEASLEQINFLPKLQSYLTNGFSSQAHWEEDAANAGIGYKYIDRINSYKKEHHMSQYTQVLPDGRRYVYGLPVYNIYQKEFEMSAPIPTTSFGDFDIGRLEYSPVSYYTYSNSSENVSAEIMAQAGSSDVKIKSETPAYAHSYLLTSVLSSDYVDVTGNGLTEDDLGNYTKFNYRQTENYKWRVPYAAKSAQRNRGLKSDCKDDKVSFSLGEREQWMLHSIESKNQVAEFYISQRADGKGAVASSEVNGGNPFDNTDNSYSYKLDKIVLYNKSDRYNNGNSAIPLKTIEFEYDYSLCANTPNSSSGKLTLKRIYIKKGTSDIGYLSPYIFKYENLNPSYDIMAKDCWGNYKAKESNKESGITNVDNINLNNLEYPYVNQNDLSQDDYSGAWNLSEISLPSGGRIKVTYESDDYSYVQDKQAMEMVKVEGAGPGREFTDNDNLYISPQSPYLYFYFRRKANENSSDMKGSYLGDNDVLQYTFDVVISSGNYQSCPNMPIVEAVKGYAKVVDVGVCTNDNTYGYIKLLPRTPNTTPVLGDIGGTTRMNPVTLAAINFTRYQNPLALNPESDIPTLTGTALINALISSMGEMTSIFKNPLKTYLKRNKAKSFLIGKSYVRLISQGLSKKGGGHRVKKIEFYDTWQGEPVANPQTEVPVYGSVYDYTIPMPGTGNKMSSGVASYEPLFGGNENPCRTLMNIHEVGNSSSFPASDPVELQQETPLGESVYPPASVGYSKVTVTSINKDKGESSQAIQEYEFYTAKDFPVKVDFDPMETIENTPPKKISIFTKKERYRVAQGYSIELNDMHGKPKQNTTWVAKYDPNNLNNNPDSRELVTYEKYNYFKNEDNTLNNDAIPCMVFSGNSPVPKLEYQRLGQETDLTFDSRYREEKTRFQDNHYSLNVFLAPPFPIGIPIPFPKNKRSEKIFSSFVNTKVIQKYGIVQSVESYNKGALVKTENTAFDPKTGQALITTVNTEFGDKEQIVKYPAYWMYTNMGSAYENIHFTEEVKAAYTTDPANTPSVPYDDVTYGSQIRNDVAYLNVSDLDRYNVGDELEITIKELCAAGTVNSKYKLWIVDKGKVPPNTWNCSTTKASPCSNITLSPSNPILYAPDRNVKRPGALNNGDCFTPQQLKEHIRDVLYENNNNSEIMKFDIVNNPISKAEIQYFCSPAGTQRYPDKYNQYSVPSCLDYLYPGGYGNTVPYIFNKAVRPGVPTNNYVETYHAIVHPSYAKNNPALPTPYGSRWTTHIGFRHEWNVKEKDVNNNYNLVYDYYSGHHLTTMNARIVISSGSHTQPTATTANSLFYDKNNPYTVYRPQSNQIVKNTCNKVFQVGWEIPSSSISYSYKNISTNYLVAKPYKIDAGEINPSTSPAKTFPENDNILSATIRVTRSGKRNHLKESVQELVVKDNFLINNSYPDGTKKIDNVINASASHFRDIATTPEVDGEFFNPYVTGEKGNYRLMYTMQPKAMRNYRDAGSSVTDADKYKGLYSIVPNSKFGTSSEEYYDKMIGHIAGMQNWDLQELYHYSAWGKPIHKYDANTKISSIGYEFNNQLPSSVVSNASQGTFFFESFEDALELDKYISMDVKLMPNPIKKWLSSNLTGNGVNLLTNGDRHTGKHALEVQTTKSFAINTGYPVKYSEFNLNKNIEYVVSCWQKVSTNGAAPPTNSGLYIQWVTSSTQQAQLVAKTPPIDGWVLYETTFTVPWTASSVSMIINGGTTVDDIRLFPAKGNMKSYVYDPLFRRVAAVLDENHIATFFEYDNEGNMIRVKKETEKGILTIKESRQSLKFQ